MGSGLIRECLFVPPVVGRRKEARIDMADILGTLFSVAFGTVLTRLVAAKEDGAFAEVDGEKIALGIPKAQMRSAEGYLHVPLRRGGTPTEAAMSILAIASPLCSYVSGHTLEVTGGYGI